MSNPFVVESPEKLLPRQIVDLFVEEHTKIETIKQRRHTLIWGSRGSGKSIMLRFLEPQCQAIRKSGMRQFLEENQSFLAIYSPCKEGQLNKTELGLRSKYADVALSDHMLNLYLADRLLDCLTSRFPAINSGFGAIVQGLITPSFRVRHRVYSTANSVERSSSY